MVQGFYLRWVQDFLGHRSGPLSVCAAHAGVVCGLLLVGCCLWVVACGLLLAGSLWLSAYGVGLSLHCYRSIRFAPVRGGTYFLCRRVTIQRLRAKAHDRRSSEREHQQADGVVCV